MTECAESKIWQIITRVCGVIAAFFGKKYTYKCIDTVLFCVAKVLIYENRPTES
jgi:hypothetical protein